MVKGVCVAKGGMHSEKGACIVKGACVVKRRGLRSRRGGHCSERYASYWNAFFLFFKFTACNLCRSKSIVIPKSRDSLSPKNKQHSTEL